MLPSRFHEKPPEVFGQNDDRLALLDKGAAAAGEQWQEVSGQSGDIKPERLDIPRRRCGKCLASIGSDTLAPKFGRNALIETAYTDGLDVAVVCRQIDMKSLLKERIAFPYRTKGEPDSP